MRIDITPRQIELFWQKVRKAGSNDCWEWTGYRNHAGYGVQNTGRGRKGHKPQLAHRIAFLLSGGELTDDQAFVLHSCDNPPCCNPAHLRAGTRLDNAIDRESRGRGGNHRGTANGRSKLTPEDVVAIRAAYTGARGQQRRLAEQYNVTPAMIRFIVHGKNWTHI